MNPSTRPGARSPAPSRARFPAGAAPWLGLSLSVCLCLCLWGAAWGAPDGAAESGIATSDGPSHGADSTAITGVPGAPGPARADSSARTAASPAGGLSAGQAIVTAPHAIVYDRPDILADALRLLYEGEIVRVLENVRDDRQATWARIAMGKESGFVRAADLQPDPKGREREWRPPTVTRDDRPLAFSLRAGAQLFGGGMSIHYLPFSRLGMDFSVGSILDGSDMKGTAISLGALSYLALNDLSPFVETGFTRLSYHEGHAVLRVQSFYLTLGLEWIFANGVFLNAMVTYARSADVEVAFDYAAADAGRTEVPPDFGILDPGDDATFQFVLPGFSLGYAF